MSNVIANLKEYHIPVTSMGEAVRNITARWPAASTGKHGYEDMIERLSGIKHETKHVKEAELVFGYLVQTAVKMHNECYINIKGSEVLTAAILKTTQYLLDNPWQVLEPETTPVAIDGVAQATTAPVSSKKRTGASKKDMCIALFNKDNNNTKTRKELIALFMKELGLTAGGASTYVFNCQKNAWK